MEFQEIRRQALAVREQYQVYEQKKYGSSWSNEELMMGFVGDIGDLTKLVMACNGKRDIPNAKHKLEHELADCLWSVIILAEVHGVNLEEVFLKTMADLKSWIQAGEVSG